MKNHYCLLLSIIGLFSGSVLAQNAKSYNPDNAYQKTLQLENNTSKEIAIVEFGKKYDLDKNNTFEAKPETSDFSGFTHQRYQQYYKGIKVEFGTAITHTRDGQVESVNGELYDAKSLNLTPNLSSRDGLTIALNFIGAQKYLWEDDNSAKAMDYVKPVGELVIFPKVNSAQIRLAYKYDIYAMSPISRDEVFVDAHTGEILYKNPIIKHLTKLVSNKEIETNAKKMEGIALGTNATFAPAPVPTRYSGNRIIATKLLSPGVYVLNEDTRGTGNGIVTYNSGKTPTYPSTNFTDATDTWNTGNYTAASSTKDNAALDAHWGAEMTYDFWKNIFGRNSYDNAGAQIKSYVHYDDVAGGAGYSNAFWNGTVMTYGDGSTRPFTALDVCGHEIGHAICSYTANLAYQNQSGAMNEALSDIWGTCIEIYGRNGNLNATADTASPGTLALWKIGEDLSSTGSSLRSMSYPTTKGNPDTYKGTNWTTTADDGTCTPTGGATGNDYCGVHNNSGVLNHWFYIVTAGKAGTNNAPAASGGPFAYNVTGIGMTKSSQITYFAERDYLTANATYADMRNATIAVASNLYCATSTEVQAVTKAWKAVNVGTDYVGYANDVALKSITGGNINVACGSAYSPSIIIENGGSANITAATITYNIDGGANSTINWTGNLTNCSTAPQAIAVSGLTRGFHTLNVTTTVAGDGNAANNTKSLVIVVNDSGTVNAVNTFNSASDVLVSIDATGKSNSVWQRGTSTKTLLSNAVAGSQVYATKLNGNYPDKTTSYLVSQCYNLSNMTNPSVNFDMAFDLESNWDIIYFEYTTDSGASWNVLGTSADANWYNSSRMPDGTDCFNCIGKQWTGDYATAPTGGTGVNGNKRNYSHSLSAFGFGGATPASNILFRIVFMSDDGANQEGAIVDNFVVQGTLSTPENQFESFGVYPNPSNGVFNVVLSTSEKVNVSLFDLRGRSIYNDSFANIGSVFSKELNFSTLSSGIYILNVESAGKKASKRIIIN
ncbi:MAG: M4 family metallopeptidase [Flavobacterium sp.]